MLSATDSQMRDLAESSLHPAYDLERAMRLYRQSIPAEASNALKALVGESPTPPSDESLTSPFELYFLRRAGISTAPAFHFTHTKTRIRVPPFCAKVQGEISDFLGSRDLPKHYVQDDIIGAAVRGLRQLPADDTERWVACYHHLFCIYTRLAIRGAIPGSLYDFSIKKGRFAPWYVVETVPGPKESYWPDLRVACDGLDGVGAEEIHQQEEQIDDEFGRGVFRCCDPWLQNRSARVETELASVGYQMLFVPVFDYYTADLRPIGVFRGWLFQYLRRPDDGPGESLVDQVTLVAKAGTVTKYVKACTHSLNLFVGELIASATTEVLLHELDDTKVEEIVREHLRRSDGWTRVVWASKPPRLMSNQIWASLKHSGFDPDGLWSAAERVFPNHQHYGLLLDANESREFSEDQDFSKSQDYVRHVTHRVRKFFTAACALKAKQQEDQEFNRQTKLTAIRSNAEERRELLKLAKVDPGSPTRFEGWTLPQLFPTEYGQNWQPPSG